MKYVRSFSFVFVLMVLAATAHAQTTSLSLNSDPGDFIGGGQSIFLTSADGNFNANQNFDGGVSIDFLEINSANFGFLISQRLMVSR